uniref:WRKY transcription factor n=1 Tax=Solanum tuberosum TaxID=4113 RepID=M1BPK7_SOLTU
MEEDWDLHAVVRSCTAASSSGSNFQPRTDNDNNNSSVFCFQDPVLKSSILLNKNKIIDDFEELHQLCKPFYTQQSEQITVISSPRKLLLQNLPPSPSPSQQQQQQFTLIQPKRPLSCTLHAQSPRTKRRKNQLKKVCEVAADGLSSDMWSWRKYGQKPIKGSPYPSRDEKEDIFEDDDDEFGVSDVGLDKMEPEDDFFDGLDELEIPATGEVSPEKFPGTFQFPWLANSAATTAAGGG